MRPASGADWFVTVGARSPQRPTRAEYARHLLRAAGRAWRAHVANYSMFNLSTIGERSSVGHIGAQASVIGDGCFVSTFATLQDLNLRGNVRVRMGDRLADSGVPFLGVALGDGVRLGAGMSIAPGRELPNGVHVVAAGAVGRIPADLAAGDYNAVDGRLVPAGTEG